VSCCRQNDSQQLINAALPSPYTTRIQETICEPPPKARTDLRQEFGATEVVSEHGAAAERVRELTGGDGTGTVLDCVGTMEVLQTAFRAVGDGGVISRVGVPRYTEGPIGMDMLMRNITLSGG